ncbi:hypothetical protein [Uliginosibacterium sp. TH139]|uniref:hypothetical protein n=1 Tax=Uliginosibacterium sp. TH139 TaxID=2067453 RepID=UPI00117E076D|nr:hypothetical protein [Uliginosibacterium sp. TH139]
MNSTVQRIAEQPHIVETLANAFDVDFSRPYDVHLWFSVQAEEKFFPFAGEGAGGVFLLGNASGFVLYVSSEGQAGVVAASLTEFLQLIVAYPNWLDLLKFSGGGRFDEMERAAPFIDQDAADDIPNIEVSRSTVIHGLSLPPAPSPISALHHAVTVLGRGVAVHAPDGSECEGLFGSFVVENNRMWCNA